MSLRDSFHEGLKVATVVLELKAVEMKDVDNDVVQEVRIMTDSDCRNEVSIYSTVYVKQKSILEVQIMRQVGGQGSTDWEF